MSEELIPDVSFETGIILDKINLQEDFSSDRNLRFAPELVVTSTLSDDSKILWLTIVINLYKFAEKEDKVLIGSIETHAGYGFNNELDPKIIQEQEVMERFSFPAYQRTAQIMEGLLRMTGTDVTLPMGRKHRMTKQTKVG